MGQRCHLTSEGTMNSIEQPHWRWAGASVTGQLHHGLNEGGQDSGSLKVHSMQCGPVLVMAVCDGAGSAKQSKSKEREDACCKMRRGGHVQCYVILTSHTTVWMHDGCRGAVSAALAPSHGCRAAALTSGSPRRTASLDVMRLSWSRRALYFCICMQGRRSATAGEQHKPGGLVARFVLFLNLCSRTA